MQQCDLARWEHTHRFNIDDRRNVRNTYRVLLLTISMMAIEIGAGRLFGSMALLADGWHMGTHVAALGITALAYNFSRRHADDPRYSFGTGKVGVLGGFVSALVLAAVALFMAIESIERLLAPNPIRFNEALVVAAISLIVNLASAFFLQERHDHAGGADHGHAHDHNLRAAYLHVLADAMTALLAILALFAGREMGWLWLDPTMGLVGAIVIARWAHGLLTDTGKILLDSGVDEGTVSAIRAAIESDAECWVSDLHVWRVGSHYLSASVAVVTDDPRPPEYYKAILSSLDRLAHVTVEVNRCPSEPHPAPQ